MASLSSNSSIISVASTQQYDSVITEYHWQRKRLLACRKVVW